MLPRTKGPRHGGKAVWVQTSACLATRLKAIHSAALGLRVLICEWGEQESSLPRGTVHILARNRHQGLWGKKSWGREHSEQWADGVGSIGWRRSAYDHPRAEGHGGAEGPESPGERGRKAAHRGATAMEARYPQLGPRRGAGEKYPLLVPELLFSRLSPVGQPGKLGYRCGLKETM